MGSVVVTSINEKLKNSNMILRKYHIFFIAAFLDLVYAATIPDIATQNQNLPEVKEKAGIVQSTSQNVGLKQSNTLPQPQLPQHLLPQHQLSHQNNALINPNPSFHKQVPHQVPYQVPHQVLNQVNPQVPHQVPQQLTNQVPQQLTNHLPQQLTQQGPQQGPQERPQQGPQQG